MCQRFYTNYIDVIDNLNHDVVSNDANVTIEQYATEYNGYNREMNELKRTFRQLLRRNPRFKGRDTCITCVACLFVLVNNQGR